VKHRNQVLRLGTQTKLEILNAYAHGQPFGHDCARRYLFEVAEAVALEETRERAASMVYEIADAIVGKIPLPDAKFPFAAAPPPPENKPSPPAQPGWRELIWKVLVSDRTIGFLCGILVGRAI